jgi:CheY-like chemotaxis protein
VDRDAWNRLLEELAMNSVLLVDDEAPIRDLLQRMLVPAGYTTHHAGDAESALAMVAATTPAAVLCDISMPGHDGLWLVEQLRERFPDVAIVLATAADTVPAATSLRAGVVAYVLKPFVRTQVLAAVADAVAWHESAVAMNDRTPPRDVIADWLGYKTNRPG